MQKEEIIRFLNAENTSNNEFKIVLNSFVLYGTILELNEDSLRFKTKNATSLISFDEIRMLIRRD